MKPRFAGRGFAAVALLAAAASCAPGPSGGSAAATSPMPSGLTSATGLFGTTGGLPKLAGEVARSGSQISRVWISWKAIEPEKGRFDWLEMDETVRSANERNMQVLGYFAFMPEWAKDRSDPKYMGSLKGRLADPAKPLDWADYTDFARAVAERYDGRHGHGRMDYVELWNEVQGFAVMSSEEYGPFLTKGYRAVKAGNPEAKVLLGAVHSPVDFDGGSSGQTTEAFITAMLRDYSAYFDIFSFHIYQKRDEAVAGAVDYMKGLLDRQGVDKPMWITETATFWPNVVCDGLAWQSKAAEGVLKRYAQAFGHGVGAIFWYSFGAPPSIEEDPAGTRCDQPADFLMGGLGWLHPKASGETAADFHPRPAFAAFRVASARLAGFTSVKAVSDTQYEFVAGGRRIYVLWSESGKASLPAGIAGSVTVTDCLGNGRKVEAATVVLGSSPVYVEPDGG